MCGYVISDNRPLGARASNHGHASLLDWMVAESSGLEDDSGIAEGGSL